MQKRFTFSSVKRFLLNPYSLMSGCQRRLHALLMLVYLQPEKKCQSNEEDGHLPANLIRCYEIVYGPNEQGSAIKEKPNSRRPILLVVFLSRHVVTSSFHDELLKHSSRQLHQKRYQQKLCELIQDMPKFNCSTGLFKINSSLCHIDENSFPHTKDYSFASSNGSSS